MNFNKYIVLTLLFLIVFHPINAYKMEADESPPKVVHQHITKEALSIWDLIPTEIVAYANNSIYDVGLSRNYRILDDIITGSAEEDLAWSSVLQTNKNHFWDPDVPNDGDYSKGLWGVGESSYNKAYNYWRYKIVPLYLEGKEDEAYYYLGRVAHLLEDAAVPAHVNLDPHFLPLAICNDLEDDSLECYTGDSWSNYDGLDYVGNQYNFDLLPNMSGFDWSAIEPQDKQHIELFRLFWYTAQKTQYFASDNVEGNSVYVNLTGNQKTFSPSLWQGEGVTIVSNDNVLPNFWENYAADQDLVNVSNAVVPHAMKAVAGLYKLFWDAVHSYEWPSFHHDLQRTGYTSLKGDLESGEYSDISWNVRLFTQNGGELYEF